MNYYVIGLANSSRQNDSSVAPLTLYKSTTGQLMFIKFLAVPLLALTGCAPMTSMQPMKAAGTGQFLQVSANGNLFMQMDLLSLAACQEEVGMITPQNRGKGDVLCNTVSFSGMLPYSFTNTSILMNVVTSTVRTKTMDACNLIRTETLKLPAASSYKASECKQS